MLSFLKALFLAQNEHCKLLVAPYSLKPICKNNSIFKARTWKYNWEACSLDLDYDDGMCVARLVIGENLDHLPFIAAAYNLWMKEDNRD